MYNFWKTYGLNLLPDAFLNTDHDEVIKIYIFYKKRLPSAFVLLFHNKEKRAGPEFGSENVSKKSGASCLHPLEQSRGPVPTSGAPSALAAASRASSGNMRC